MGFFQLLFVGLLFTNYCSSSWTSGDKQCSVKIPENKLLAPVFEKKFGTKKIKFSNFNETHINFRNGEEITGYCATKFEPLFFEAYEEIEDENAFYDSNPEPELKLYSKSDIKTVTIKCNLGKTNFLDTDSMTYRILEIEFLSCKNFGWSIYEVKSPHYWCSNESNSYILGTKSLEDNILLAGICFNLQNMQLESIRYTNTGYGAVFTQNHLTISSPPELNPDSLYVNIEDYHLEMSKDDSWQTTEKIAKNASDFHEMAIYRRDLIIQEAFHKDILQNYEEFLKINWWHNLLYGNWQRFVYALNQQTTKYVYDTFMGISGGIREPYYINCNEKDIKEIQNPQFIQHDDTMPAYIWTYLSGRYISEEVVIIAYNSPYFEFFDAKDIVFCKDICNDILWLKNASNTFSYSALGIIFCCTPEDVRNAGVLKGFPSDVESIDMLSTTTTTTTTKAPKSISEQYDSYLDEE